MKCQKRKKYDAHQFDGSYSRMMELQRLFPDMQNASCHNNKTGVVEWWLVNEMDVNAGDFIIRDEKGKFQVCSQDRFYKEFEWTKP